MVGSASSYMYECAPASTCSKIGNTGFATTVGQTLDHDKQIEFYILLHLRHTSSILLIINLHRCTNYVLVSDCPASSTCRQLTSEILGK